MNSPWKAIQVAEGSAAEKTGMVVSDNKMTVLGIVHNLFMQNIFLKINVIWALISCVNICPMAEVSAETLILKAEQSQFYSLKSAVPVTW